MGQIYRLRDGRIGQCKFVGKINGKKGEWVGLELENEFEGKHDGMLNGIRYFKCSFGQGKKKQ